MCRVAILMVVGLRVPHGAVVRCVGRQLGLAHEEAAYPSERDFPLSYSYWVWAVAK
jgi:hypothetical protein